MEILRFDDAERTSARRNKSSRGMIVVGLVATLFGVGTAFASTTITINGGSATNIGQGISAVSACDDDIKISVNNSLNVNNEGKIKDETGTVLKGENAKPKFTTSGLVLSGINSNSFDTTTATGCGGEILEVQIFQQVGRGTESIQQVYQCGILGLSSGKLDYLEELDSPFRRYQNVDCVPNGKIRFVVPVTNSLTSSWLIPLKVSPGNSPLDISYFTVISESA